MRLGRNFTAGLVHSLWSMLVGLAAVPFYINYLGVEAYGLIGFAITLQGLMMLLDLGLAPALSRQVARAQITGTVPEVRNLLHTLSYFYWGTAAIIALAIGLAAPLIATNWLTANQIDHTVLERAVFLIGLLIAGRWPSGLYLGTLQGAHRLTTASVVGIGWTTASSLGGIAILAFVSPTIEALLLWQALVGISYTLALRSVAWDAIHGPSGPRFDLEALRGVWRFALGMGGVALTATIFTQLDKVILSKLLSLTEFGYFMLATALAGILYRVIVPLFNAMTPRFTSLVAAGDETQLTQLYHLVSNVFASAFFPAALALVLCAEPLILFWTQDEVIADRAAPLMMLLTIGSALHSMMYFPYALQLAYGLARLPLLINGLLMLVQLPLVVMLTSSYGAVGGAAAWLILHIMYVALGTWLTHRRLLSGVGSRWLFRDVGIPFAISATVGSGTALMLGLIPQTPILTLGIGLGASLVALLISASLCTYKPAEIRAVFRH